MKNTSFVRFTTSLCEYKSERQLLARFRNVNNLGYRILQLYVLETFTTKTYIKAWLQETYTFHNRGNSLNVKHGSIINAAYITTKRLSTYIFIVHIGSCCKKMVTDALTCDSHRVILQHLARVKVSVPNFIYRVVSMDYRYTFWVGEVCRLQKKMIIFSQLLAE